MPEFALVEVELDASTGFASAASELIKNRRYEFWNHSFVKCAPEVEKLFQSVAYTCLGTCAWTVW